MRNADAVIVGAGIQGCSMALAAVARGVRPLVIDSAQPGAGASGASYGIVHGGLRYLQSLDVARWRRSRRARDWYAARYRRHVRPVRCVMPLYSHRLRSPAAFGAAFTLERALERLFSLPSVLPPAELWDRRRALALPGIVQDGLVGAAAWSEIEIADAGALLNAMIEEAERQGAALLAGHEAFGLERWNGAVRSVIVRDRTSGKRHEIRTTCVIDCAGASAGRWTAARSPAPTAATLAFNLELDLPPPPATMLALSPDPGRGRSYFLRERAGRTYAGTFYRPLGDRPEVSDEDVALALRELALCLPGASLQAADVRAVTAAPLPDRDGTGATLDARDRHLRDGEPGYHFVRGGKLTTAPLLSERAAAAIWPRRTISPALAPVARHA